MKGTLRVLAWLLVLAHGVPAVAEAQYFGRNKVQYRTFDFQILRTEHFDLYYYPEEAEAAEIVSRMAERWHARLARFFGHSLRGRQPIILYAAASHFRQTNAVEGLIGEGTGGVTEALKRRIALPMAGSLAETDHVLGHELVHAFQFDLTGTDPRDGPGELPGILAFPLWYVEGMAEYLSVGPVDAQTAMWMRDAAARNALPAIRDLEHPKYFPYRWGHAFWAFIGAKYGDRSVASLIRSGANPRVDLTGLARQLGSTPHALTAEWHAAIRLMAETTAADEPALTSASRRIIGPDTGAGRFNVGPRVSPDGRHVVFFSERDRFSVELFLADVETGKIRRKLLKSATDPHFDSLEFLNSAGAWSPDGRALAVAAQHGGRPVLALLDPANGRIRRELKFHGLDDVLHPVFSPDGASIVVSGNRGGLIDLYRITIATGAVEQLTQDPFADLEPVFTPDGRSLVFVTERFSTNLETLEPGPLRLARIDLDTKHVTPISAFLRGKHISPQMSADGRVITFIADPDGVSNLYRIGIDGGPVERLSSVATGVAGVTAASPALSASASGRLVFSVFGDGGHSIHLIDPDDVVALVPPQATAQAAVLPGRSMPGGDVDRFLADHARGLPASAPAQAGEPYRRRLSLDMIGQPTVSANVSQFGGTVSGGMSAVFSDMLGDRALGVGGQIAGTLADFGGQLIYVNRRHRWNWAAAVEATPYRMGYFTVRGDPATGNTVVTEIIERQPSRGAYGVIAYPFNAAARVEFSGGAQALSFTREVRTGTYDSSRRLVDVQIDRTEIARPLYLSHANAAFVYDTSFFGVTSPIFGSRYRFEMGQTGGSLKYMTVLADWRRYFMPVEPSTIAVRAVHYGRYGHDSEHEQLVPLYAGYPEFVRGYGVGSFSAAECLTTGGGLECGVFKSLIGSRLAVVNVEWRAPLVGLFKGQLDYGRVPVEIAAFADAGLAWTSADRPDFAGGSRRIVRSAGVAARINVMGLFALELSGARPFDRLSRGIQWQIGIRPGF